MTNTRDGDWTSQDGRFQADWSGLTSVALCTACNRTWGPYGSRTEAVRFMREHAQAEHAYGTGPCPMDQQCERAYSRRGGCDKHARPAQAAA